MASCHHHRAQHWGCCGDQPGGYHCTSISQGPATTLCLLREPGGCGGGIPVLCQVFSTATVQGASSTWEGRSGPEQAVLLWQLCVILGTKVRGITPTGTPELPGTPRLLLDCLQSERKAMPPLPQGEAWLLWSQCRGALGQLQALWQWHGMAH